MQQTIKELYKNQRALESEIYLSISALLQKFNENNAVPCKDIRLEFNRCDFVGEHFKYMLIDVQTVLAYQGQD